MRVFRIHIRPQGGTANMRSTFEYCLKNNLLGVGWRVNSLRNTKSWDEYFDKASAIHDNLNVCQYIKKWLQNEDLVWTRDMTGTYFLAQVTSGWEYWMSPEARLKDIDIANVFRCNFQPIDIDAVPGKIVACFRAPRTIQEVTDPKAVEYSKYLWNTLSGRHVYKVDQSAYSDIFMMLDDEETEDLVFLYLQSKGWYVLPNSRKADTMCFEYLAVNPQSGEVAWSQVKTGNVPLNRDDYTQCNHKVFLFQSNELYFGAENNDVVCIPRSELLGFINASINWLPKSFQTKVKLIER